MKPKLTPTQKRIAATEKKRKKEREQWQAFMKRRHKAHGK